MSTASKHLYRLLCVSTSKQLHLLQGHHVQFTVHLYTEKRPFLPRYSLHKLTERTFPFSVTNSSYFSDIYFVTNCLLQNTTVFLVITQQSKWVSTSLAHRNNLVYRAHCVTVIYVEQKGQKPDEAGNKE